MFDLIKDLECDHEKNKNIEKVTLKSTQILKIFRFPHSKIDENYQTTKISSK